MLKYFPFFLSIIFLSTIPRLNAHGYCVDAYCPFKCCQDFYNCAISTDCQSSFKSFTYPYPEEATCTINSDCVSDCCYSSQCKSKATCTIIRAVVSGCIGLVFVIIVWVVFMVIRKRRKNKEKETNMIQINKIGNEEELTEASMIQNENFDAKEYCEKKLEMNLGVGPLGFGMPCKPKEGENKIISNFKIIT